MIRSSLRRALAACALILLIFPALALANPAAPSGPGVTFTTPGGARIWYEVRGSAAGRPLIMVNGGPGFDHTYVLCSDAWDTIARSRRVVFYDQRGNGRSGALKTGSRARSPTRSPISTRCGPASRPRRSTCSGTRGAATSSWRMRPGTRSTSRT